MTKQVKHRKWRRTRGYCAYEGCPMLANGYYCPDHRLKRQQYQRDWYARRGRELRQAKRETAAA